MNVQLQNPIGHYSAALRKLLEIEEEEALGGKIKIKRQLLHTAQQGSRWKRSPCFNVPGPFSEGRPVSAQGRVSFHYAQDTVCKGPNGTSLITSGRGTKALTANALADHDSYVSREGAVLTVSASAFEQYTGRRPSIDQEAGVTLALMSNISADPSERQAFWVAVNRSERDGKPDCLKFFRNKLDQGQWRLLADCQDLPEDVREIAAAMATSKDESVREKRKTKPKADAVLPMPWWEGEQVRKIAKGVLGTWGRKQDPLKVAKGRFGRTQNRIAAELPADLEVGAYLRIMEGLRDRLEAQGVMYTMALHAPDEHYDERNHHLHVVTYERPCRKVSSAELRDRFGVETEDMWDFEFRKKVKGHNTRWEYPLRQNKIAALSRSDDGTEFSEHRRQVITADRAHFAELCNKELQAAGITRLFDPRSYKAMGIDQEPTKPLGPQMAPLEAVGIPTATGIVNAEIIWSAALKTGRTKCADRKAMRDRLLAEFADTVRLLEGRNLKADASALRTQETIARRHAEHLDKQEWALEECGITFAMAYARPEKAITTCDKILTVVAGGKGRPGDRANQSMIEARRNAAQAFVNKVDAIFALGQRDLDRCVEANAESNEWLEDAKKHLARMRARASEATVSPPSSHTPTADVPVAHGPTTAASEVRAQLDMLLKIILDERVIVAPKGEGGLFTVPGISREEFRLLSSPSLDKLVQARLSELAGIQTQRVLAAIAVHKEYGDEGLRRRSATDSSAARAIRHLEVYKAHPKIVAYELAKHEVQRAALEAASRAALKQVEAAQSAPHDDLKGGVVAPEVLIVETKVDAVEDARWVLPVAAGPDPSRQAAIEAYATYVAEYRGLKLLIQGEAIRVDLTSIDDFHRSAEAFEDEPKVLAALAVRHAEDEALKAREAQDKADAELRNRILIELQNSKVRPVYFSAGRWWVDGVSSELWEIANKWQSHPELARAYSDFDQVWEVRERKAKTEASRVTPEASPMVPTMVKPPVAPKRSEQDSYLEVQRALQAQRNRGGR